MSPRKLQTIIAAAFLLSCLTLAAQENGDWRPAGNTARSITGDVALSKGKIFINFSAFPLARIRTLDQAETSAAFDTDNTDTGTGTLYRLSIPATKKFLHKNSLCGDEEAQWMVAYVSGRTLQLAFFSGEKPPIFTFDAISNSTDLCGTFSYTK